MKVLKPRSRMISVRLSEEEHAALTRLCSLTGARSASDLVRDAMQSLLNGNHDRSASDRTDEIHAQMLLLNRQIESLANRISASLPELKH